MERDDEIEKISKELEDMLRMTSENKREQEGTERERVNPVPPEKPEGGDRPGDILEDFSLVLDLEKGSAVPDGAPEPEEQELRSGKTPEKEHEELLFEENTRGEEDAVKKTLVHEPHLEPEKTGSGSNEAESCGERRSAGNMSRGGQESKHEENGAARRDDDFEGACDLEEQLDFFLEPGPDEEYDYDYDEESEFPEPVREKERFRRREARDGGSLIRPSDGLTAAFFVPIIIMIIIFAQRGIFPFGEESFLRTDMYHQYAPFFSEFQHKLTAGGSLLYSWDVGLGVNFAALYAYYLASPLNWLLVLCPKAYIIEFMTYMIVFKIGLCGLSFAYYLRKHCRTSDFGIAFFGIFYALSGYMAAYSWNIMWLDCILLFPLIMLGLERLVREKKCFLYCITLGLSILSNYYISIMICIFMVLYFIALLLMDGRKSWKEYGANIGMFAVFSLLAGGLAAAVLLPEVYALQMTASGDFNFPKTVTSYFSIFDMLARHLPDVETEIGLDHWPNIYCGVAVLMLFLLYLVSRQIKRREKVVYCGLLLFFFASFSFNVLNFIWHGFHYPNSLPCRQSFIYIFLMLLMCYQAYSHLRETPWKHVVLAFFGAVVFVLMAQKLITDDAYHFSVFYVAIVFLAAYVGLIGLYQKGTNRNVIVLLALGVVSVEAAVNTTVTSVTTTSRTSYVRDNEASEALTRGIMDSSFYRVEKVTRKTKNDGAWMNFPSVSLFSSTANADLSKFFKKLGCESSTNAYSITGSTPLVDSLFSVKYALYSETPADTGLLTPVNVEDHTYLYRNEFTLPLGVMVPYDLEDNWQLDVTNPADVQNDLAVVLGASPVLEEVPSEILGTSFTFTPEVSGDYYVYVSNKKVEKVSALMGENTKSFDNINRGYLLELGWIPAGEEVTLRNDDNDQDLVAMAYRFLPEGLESVYNVLNRNSMELTKKSDTEIAGRIEAEKAGILYLSIPYDEGWTIYVDGEETAPYKLFDTFLSVRLAAGTHTVELKYMPQGLKTGAMITAGSMALLLLLAAVTKGRRKKPAMRRRIKC